MRLDDQMDIATEKNHPLHRGHYPSSPASTGELVVAALTGDLATGAAAASPKRWYPTIRIQDLLERCLEEGVLPPAQASVYLITEELWTDWADVESARPLYVGSNTRNPRRFRTRVGDFLADLFGFYTRGHSGHHSGAQTLHRWCSLTGRSPLTLCVAWLEECECPRTSECEVFWELESALWNKNVPSQCAAGAQCRHCARVQAGSRRTGPGSKLRKRTMEEVLRLVGTAQELSSARGGA